MPQSITFSDVYTYTKLPLPVLHQYILCCICLDVC